MKKFISMFMAVAMLIACLSLGVLADSKAPVGSGEYSLSVDKTEVAVGETITVTVSLEAEGVYNVEGILTPSENLEYASHKILAGSEFAQLAFNPANSKFSAIGRFANGYNGEVDLLTITYLAVAAGGAEVNLTDTVWVDINGKANKTENVKSEIVNISLGECSHENKSVENVAPSCSKEGLHKVICNSCGEVLVNDVLPKIPHIDSGNGKCSVCGMYIELNLVWGDVNGDDVVDNIDAMLVLQLAVKIPVEGINEDVADVDGNGEIDNIDAMLILQYAVKLLDKFPVEA